MIIVWKYCQASFGKPKLKYSFLAFMFSSFIIFMVSIPLITSLNILAFLVICFINIYFYYDTKLTMALFHSSIITIMMSACEMLILGIVTLFRPDLHSIMNERWSVLLALLTKLAFYLVIITLTRFYPKPNSDTTNYFSRQTAIDIVPLLSFCVIVIQAIVAFDVSSNTTYHFLVSVSSLIMIILNIIVYWINYHMQMQQQQFTELLLQTQMVKDITAYQQMYSVRDEEQRVLIHDIKNHLHTIRFLNAQGNTDEISEYIDRLINSDTLTNQVCLCDNDLINAILIRYRIICRQQNITFDTDIRNHVLEGFDNNHITSLLCNLLDNAVTAAGTSTEKTVYITIQATNNNGYIIKVDNSCDSNPFDNRGNLIKTLKHGKFHGIGITSIKKIIDSHNGDIDMSYDEERKIFHTIIFLR